MPRPRLPPLPPARRPLETSEAQRLLGLAARRLRLAHGYGVEQAAGRMGLEPRQLRRIERGQANLTLDSLLGLAAGLGLAPSVLLGSLEEAASASMPSAADEAAEGLGGAHTPEPEEEAPRSIRSWLARIVVSRRRANHLTQRELAVRAGISMSAVQSVERGRHAPTTETLEALAAALGCTLAELLPAHEVARIGDPAPRR